MYADRHKMLLLLINGPDHASAFEHNDICVDFFLLNVIS